MDRSNLEILIKRFESGEVTQDELVGQLESLFVLDLDFAQLDMHRSLREGFPEVIYGPGKTPQQVSKIVQSLLSRDGDPTVILSRASVEQVRLASERSGEPKVFYHGLSEIDSGYLSAIWNPSPPRNSGKVSIVTAGTADLSVAREAEAVFYALGIKCDLIPDCGVAGIHRLFQQLDHIRSADVVVVIAGMEGALASVVGGLVRSPVIAVPTSVGYGSSFEGVTALLAMLSSCSPGISVVGIDNGLGAAASAIRILDYGQSRLD